MDLFLVRTTGLGRSIRSVEGSSTSIGGWPFLYCLGKGQERSFPLTSTYYKGWGGTGSNQTAAFLNGYPLSSELNSWTGWKGNLYKAFFTRLRDQYQRKGLLHSLPWMNWHLWMVVHSGFFYLYLELLDQLLRLLAFETSGTLKSLARSNSSVHPI